MLEQVLNDPGKIVVLQYSAASIHAISELIDIKPGKALTGLVNTAMKRCGFNYVFETAWGADIMTMELAALIRERSTSEIKLPLITSSCPALVNYIENFYPDLIPCLSPLKSPHQILGKLIKSWFAEYSGILPEDIFSVAVSPCIAAKTEASSTGFLPGGNPDIDAVLTTRELARLIKLNGLNVNQLEPEETDLPFNSPSSGGRLCALAGGEMEAIQRILKNTESSNEISGYRSAIARGPRKIKKTDLSIGNDRLITASVSGMETAKALLEEINAGKCDYQAIEIMACPDGCVNGGGQPIGGGEMNVKARIKAICDDDNLAPVKAAHLNDQILKLYKTFLGEPAGKKSQQLFNTGFSARKVLR